MNIKEHLQYRHLDIDLHRPWLDYENNLATFPVWNLSGQLVGYHQYRPHASKKKNNDPKDGRYFTYTTPHTVCVWGVETITLSNGILFVTEGVFDACRLTELGVSAVAVLSNDPRPDVKNWLHSLNKTIVAVCDQGRAGVKLAKLGHHSIITDDKDLGDSSEEYVKQLIDFYCRK